MNELLWFCAGNGFRNFLPQLQQKRHVGKQNCFLDAFGSGAGDEAAGLMLVAEMLHAHTKPSALGFIFDTLRHTDIVGERHVYHVARRNGKLGGQACAFAADGIFGDLHYHILAFPQVTFDFRGTCSFQLLAG